MKRDANNTKTVIFTIFFAFVLYGHKAEECNMTAYVALGESVQIPEKLHECVMETSFLLDTALLSVQLAYEDANAPRYPKNAIFRVFFIFFLPETYGEQKATLWCRTKRSAHVSWKLQ